MPSNYNNSNDLADPFSRIFKNLEEAMWAFDFFLDAFEHFGISDPDDQRFALTLRHKNQTLRLNYGMWAVLQFYGSGSGLDRVGIAFLDDRVNFDATIPRWNPFVTDDGIVIRVYELPIELARNLPDELQLIYKETFAYIAERFKNWVACPYRRYNQPKIAAAVLDPKQREQLFTNGLNNDKPPSGNPKIWWVNQGQNLVTEASGGYLWAPYKARDGRTWYHWDTMDEVREGDIILHYANGALRYISQASGTAENEPLSFTDSPGNWESEGRMVQSEYYDLLPPIPLENFSTDLQLFDIPQGPINQHGGVKQGYLFRFSIEALKTIIKSTSDVEWPDFITNLESPKESVEISVVNPHLPLAAIASKTGFNEEELTHWVRAIERKGQSILYGPPGTGKTFIAEQLAQHLIGGGDGFWELVQFHPAYAYEDFVQGIRPEPSADGGLDYPVVPGRFLEFCEEARKREGHCVLIIDEINRANLSRVFGELMYLLEYRDQKIPLAAGGNFAIPKNVRIIGTMNTADRSIALVDHALRRRFAFLKLAPKYEVLRRYHEGTRFPVESLIKLLKELNNEIGDAHYHIGITYFLDNELDFNIEDIWKMEIVPYLEEYFFDQTDKVEKYTWEKIKSRVLL